MSPHDETADPLQPHSHEPNPAPPSDDPSFELLFINGRSQTITVQELHQLPVVSVPDCYIVSTGHGTSGPFTFTGVTLLDFVTHFCGNAWSEVEVVSADGFGNRVYAHELHQPDPAGSILLAYQMDGEPLTRQQGLVRMIVPSERDDALRQVKWVGKVRVVGA
ncbi:molybdopterin-dependent oxidoreductase [Candidatus Leptofilum sp.]|uniref:molybdopterin-dependent oxidoreductase n=1 Tax=Candidatus Leptofilum sp. TaxID=3241576 RepID=UPI003B5B1161